MTRRFAFPALVVLLLSSLSFAVSSLDPAGSTPPAQLSTYSSRLPALKPEDLHLSPILLVATLDGGLHALDRETGVKMWGLSGLGGSMAWSRETLVPGAPESAGFGHERFLVDPKKGDIWIGRDDGNGTAQAWDMKRMGVTVPDLVQASFLSAPVHLAQDSDPDRVFVGRVETSLVGVNLETGLLVGEYGEESTFEEGTSEVQMERGRRIEGPGVDDLELLLDDMEGWHADKGGDVEARLGKILYITRTDYTLRIHSTSPTASRRTQTLHYSTYGPSNPSRIDPVLTSIWGERLTADGRFGLLAMKSSESKDFEGAGVFGVSRVENPGPGQAGFDIGWAQELGSLPIAFFDILTLVPPSSMVPSAPFILPQAQPPVAHLYGSGNKDPNIKPPRLPQILFIGRLPATSNDGPTLARSSSHSPSLFVLSRDNHPLIGSTELFPAKGVRGRRLEGYHVLDSDVESVNIATDPYIDGVRERLGIDPSRPSSDNESSFAVDETFDGDDHASPSNEATIWTALLLYLPLALLGLAGIRRSLSLVSPTAKNQVVSAVTAVSPSQFAPTTLSPSVKGPSSLGSPPSTTNSESILPLEDVGKKKRRRAPRSGKKGKGGDGAEDGRDENTKEPALGRSPSPLGVKVEVVDLASGETEMKRSELTVSDKVLGVGSHGTVVFEGTFQARPVAVKRLVSHFTTLASHEVSVLQSADHHPNIVRYFYEEKRDSSIFIALELCPASLYDLIERPREFQTLVDLFNAQKALAEVTKGVRHLHELKIYHRDLKPQNILISRSTPGTIKMLISDFGLAKRIPIDQSSYGATLAPATAAGALAPTGTPGWRAPEVLLQRESDSSGGEHADEADWEVVRDSGANAGGSRGRKGARPVSRRLTSAVDVFALGCVFYWVLTKGDHPYGERMDRERNICKGRHSLSRLDAHGEEGREARDLIAQMLESDNRNRPTTNEILLHPYFWSNSRRLSFLQDASDSFEILERDPPDALLLALEAGASRVIGPTKDWMRAMDQNFIDSLGKYRKYDVSSLRDLLRALRNKRHHFLDLPEAARKAMSPLPDGFLLYFTQRFPHLFLHVYSVVSRTALREDSVFDSYFTS